ncbi:MAG: tetratricopeptide repeat protein, partial [Blastocatellia bacterium]|nr:tetratricopeptide repeat protein [Blastocatellia bacterium]
MKGCPTCQRLFPSVYKVCLIDGTPLIEQNGPAQKEAPARAPTEPPLRASIPTPPERLARWAQNDAWPQVKSRRWLWWAALAGAAVMAALVIYVAVWPMLIERRFYAALEQGRLVTPEGNSAYELYQQLNRRKPNSPMIAQAHARTLPLVKIKGDEIFQRWYKEAKASDDDWTTAQKLYDWAAQMDPHDSHWQARRYYCRGQIAFRAQRDAEAIEAYQQAINYEPQWSLPYNSLGVLHARRRQFDTAIRWYTQAAAYDPTWSFPHSNLATAYMALQQYDNAEAALLKAIALDDARPLPHLRLSEVYEKQNRLADA